VRRSRAACICVLFDFARVKGRRSYNPLALLPVSSGDTLDALEFRLFIRL